MAKVETFVIFATLFLGLPGLVAAELISPRCPQNQTAFKSVQVAAQQPTAKGTGMFTLVLSLSEEKEQINTKTILVPDLTYQEAQLMGVGVPAFAWFAAKIVSYEELKANLEGQKSAKIDLLGCCSAGICSKCCPRGGCVCKEWPSGNCSCSQC